MGPVPDLCPSQLLKPSFAYRKIHRKATYTIEGSGPKERAERVMLEWRLQPLAEIPIVMYYNPAINIINDSSLENKEKKCIQSRSP